MKRSSRSSACAGRRRACRVATTLTLAWDDCDSFSNKVCGINIQTLPSMTRRYLPSRASIASMASSQNELRKETLKKDDFYENTKET